MHNCAFSYATGSIQAYIAKLLAMEESIENALLRFYRSHGGCGITGSRLPTRSWIKRGNVASSIQVKFLQEVVDNLLRRETQ